MDALPTQTVTAILSHEKELEMAINHLIQETVAKHDISVENTSAAIAQQYGIESLKQRAQASHAQAKKEPFLVDDFGWVLGFSFSLPFILGIIIGVFIVGDINSIADNFFYGMLGALSGGALGGLFARFIHARRMKQHKKQEDQGGFLIWVTITSPDKLTDVIAILKMHQATHITIE